MSEPFDQVLKDELYGPPKDEWEIAFNRGVRRAVNECKKIAANRPAMPSDEVLARTFAVAYWLESDPDLPEHLEDEAFIPQPPTLAGIRAVKDAILATQKPAEDVPVRVYERLGEILNHSFDITVETEEQMQWWESLQVEIVETVLSIYRGIPEDAKYCSYRDGEGRWMR